jgi:hypothetical protein
MDWHLQIRDLTVSEAASVLSVLVPVVTALAGVSWRITSAVSKFLVLKVKMRVPRHTISLQCDKSVDDLRRLAEFRCLLVRFGTDLYLRDLASDQDREEGRTQLKKIKLAMQHDANDNPQVILKLPVHPTLGTQFKIYAEKKPDARMDDLIAALNKAVEKGCIHGVDASDSLYPRVYFLVTKFATVPTIERVGSRRVINNYIFPE